MSAKTPPPRLYGIVASNAPYAVVFRRASGYWHVARWDLASGRLEPGAWFRGSLYPRRCDLSSDGELLSVTAADWRSLGGYVSISRAPWLHSLALWKQDGTWTRGYHFAERGTWEVGEPDQGAVPLSARRFGLAVTGTEQHAVERRRGFREHPESPARSPRDAWDERRSAILRRPRPSDPERLLVLRDLGLDHQKPGIEGRRPRYEIECGDELQALEGVVWADWDLAGRLVVATDRGTLELRKGEAPNAPPLVVHDLARMTPKPEPAPEWATSWTAPRPR